MAQEQYDIVIMGSGLGGLVCGTILSKEGFKVCIIEKNRQIGGNLQTFKRDGVKFDTGVHYLGGLDKGQNLNKLFTYLGIMERLKIERMDPTGFDLVLFKDDVKEYPYGMGHENFIRIMCQNFPDEEEAIREYCREIKNICSRFPLYNISDSDDYPDSGLFSRGAKQYIESLTANKTLRAVLAGTNLLYAGVADKTPLYIHALVVNSYIESAWRCTDGGDQIAKLLAKQIISAGGIIKRETAVKRIEASEGKVDYIELDTGETMGATNFISNIHPGQTLERMSTESFRPAYRQRIGQLENTVSAFVVYAVLKPKRRKYLNRNYYYFGEADAWKGIDYTGTAWPYSYGLFECVPKQQREYLEGISIISYMRFDEVKQWENTHNTTLDERSRGNDYEAFKNTKAEQIFKVLEEKFPDIRQDIEKYYCATPLSYRDYIGTADGNMYGIAKSFNDPLTSRVSPKTKLPNLYFTGQNVNLHGVLGVTISAVLTCSMLIGKKYLVEKIRQANEYSC